MTAEAEPLRAALVRATQAVHTALHHDPVLARLADPALTDQQYRQALSVFAAFYTAIEQARALASLFPELSLASECGALDRDVGRAKGQAVRFASQGRAHLLGALYVAHGAAFGRNTMRANVTSRLPLAPHGFICLPMPAARWRTLKATLEEVGKDAAARQLVINGASDAFALMSRLSRHKGQDLVFETA